MLFLVKTAHTENVAIACSLLANTLSRDRYRIFGWGGDKIILLECQTCIRYVIVLTILHILIGIGLTNKINYKKSILNCS